MAFSKPLVSVIIPVYNVEHYIEQCVRSVIEQEYDNKEIILVNDGSTDGTIEVVRRCFHDYPHITIIEQENQGAAWARKMDWILQKVNMCSIWMEMIHYCPMHWLIWWNVRKNHRLISWLPLFIFVVHRLRKKDLSIWLSMR